jgi:hypothetical protein
MGGGDGGALVGNNPNVDERLGMISCRKFLAGGRKERNKGSTVRYR